MSKTITDHRHISSVLIVDDHPLFCDALAMTLKAVAGLREVHTAARLEEAVALLEGGMAPDAIFLDLNLPDVDGLEGLIRLRSVSRLPVIVVSSLTDMRVVTSAIRGGAAGYIPKHSAREVFRAAIDALRASRTFLPDGLDLLDADACSEEEDALNRLTALTNQQSRILQLICEGKLNKQIAFDLSIAETTVKAHVTAIMRKLGAQSRTQAVLIARKASFAGMLQEATRSA